MNTIKVSTTQQIDIDYDVAGLGERMLGWLIDAGIFVLLFLAGGILAAIMADMGFDEVGFIVLLVIYGLLYVFYDLVCEVFFNGQSVGKRAMKIKVISLDGTQPTLGQYLLRWVFRIVDFVLTSGIGAVISIAITPNKQRIGDIVANTTLIKTTPRAGLSSIAFVRPTTDDYQPRFPEASRLRDSDIELIHDVLHNYTKSGNRLLVRQMANKLKEHLQVAIPQDMNALQFLHAVVKDYQFIAARD